MTKFKQFDHKGPGLKPSWNWPAFFFTGFWALYRKMYGWFFAFLGLITFSNLFEKAGIPDAWVAVLAAQIVFGIYATSIYHGHVRKKIAVGQLLVRDESKLFPHLQQKSGVHAWVIWVLAFGTIFSIFVAIAIPAYNDSRQPSRQQSQPSKIGGINDLALYADGSRFNFDFAAARSSGPTDDQIFKYLLNKDPRLKVYAEQGYSAAEILDAMEQKSKAAP